MDNLLQLDDLITHIVLRKDSELVGTAAVCSINASHNTGDIFGIFGENKYYLQVIINQLVKICRSNNMEVLQMQFTHLKQNNPQILLYEELGFQRKK